MERAGDVYMKLLNKEISTDSPLMSFDDFCSYMGIGETKARELISKADCRYVVRIGRRVLIHKELLDAELAKAAKFRLTL